MTRIFVRLSPQATPEAALDLAGPSAHPPRLFAIPSCPGSVVGSVEITPVEDAAKVVRP